MLLIQIRRIISKIVLIFQLCRLTELIDHSVLEKSLKMEQNEHREVYALVFSQKHVCLRYSIFSLIFRIFIFITYFVYPRIFLQNLSKILYLNYNVLISLL